MVVEPLQSSITPAHRSTRWVGRTRRRLACLIDAALADAGYVARVDPSRLCPAQGRWRSDFRFDVKRWEGSVEIEVAPGCWVTYGCDSWQSMTSLVAKGLEIELERGVFECWCRA